MARVEEDDGNKTQKEINGQYVEKKKTDIMLGKR